MRAIAWAARSLSSTATPLTSIGMKKPKRQAMISLNRTQAHRRSRSGSVNPSSAMRWAFITRTRRS